MNLLDRGIAWLSPSWGLSRARARAASGVLQRSYDGAGRGRRSDGWVSLGGSANATIAPALARLRENARDLYRNHPLARRAVNILVANIVGTGIIPRAKGRSAKGAQRAFARWARRCDLDGRADYYGLQALAVRTAILSGESLTVRHALQPDRMPGEVPLQIQVLEGDHLDLAKTEPTAAGGYVLQGVEFDAVGRRVAYWLFPQHPGDQSPIGRGFSLTSRRVPAEDVIHLYRLDRPGQVRGVPWLDVVVTKLRDLGDYDEAELVRKKIEACLAAFVVGAHGEEPSIAGTRTDRATGQRVETFEPGMIAYLSEGQDVKFAEPRAAGGHAEYYRTQSRIIAVGTGNTYENLSGDLSTVNYSSYRAGDLMQRRLVDADRWHMVIPVWCDGTWGWFARAGRIAGLVGDESIEAEWVPPAYESVDPYKDAMATLLLMRMGQKTPQEAIAERGLNFDEQIADLAAAMKLLDQYGIILDSDPRHQARNGNRATAPAGPDTQPET